MRWIKVVFERYYVHAVEFQTLISCIYYTNYESKFVPHLNKSLAIISQNHKEFMVSNFEISIGMPSAAFL